jgi:hypothetical protein
MSSPFLNPVFSKSVVEPTIPTRDLVDRPALAVAYVLAGGLMEICGPLFWAVLATEFLLAEFGLD